MPNHRRRLFRHLRLTVLTWFYLDLLPFWRWFRWLLVLALVFLATGGGLLWVGLSKGFGVLIPYALLILFILGKLGWDWFRDYRQQLHWKRLTQIPSCPECQRRWRQGFSRRRCTSCGFDGRGISN